MLYLFSTRVAAYQYTAESAVQTVMSGRDLNFEEQNTPKVESKLNWHSKAFHLQICGLKLSYFGRSRISIIGDKAFEA